MDSEDHQADGSKHWSHSLLALQSGQITQPFWASVFPAKVSKMGITELQIKGQDKFMFLAEMCNSCKRKNERERRKKNELDVHGGMCPPSQHSKGRGRGPGVQGDH